MRLPRPPHQVQGPRNDCYFLGSFTRLRADAPQLAVGRKREVTAPKPWRRRVSHSGAVPLCSFTDALQLAAGSFTVIVLQEK
jgi:hypothetical protein